MARSLSSLKLRQIEYFLAVADALSFTRAAETLGSTQPTLSHQIAELEGHLGLCLFDRIGKTVRLTEAGRLFQSFAGRAAKQLEGGVLALSELEGLTRGVLRLGVIQSISATLLPPILGAFLRRHPGVQISVTEMTAREIETGLAEGSFDLGIAFAPAVREETELEPILSEELLLVVGRHHPLADRVSVKLASLDGLRMALLAPNYSTRQLIDRYLDAAKARPVVVLTTNAMSVMLATALDSDLATIVPEHGLPRELPHGLRCVRLTEPRPARTSALLWPRYGVRTGAARAFSAMVRQHMQASA